MIDAHGLGAQDGEFERGEGERAAGEHLRLLEMGEVAGLVDQLEARARNGGAEGAAVALVDAVVLAPQHQGRDADAVQPALELGVVHVGLPGEAAERFAVARDDAARPRAWPCSRARPIAGSA